MSSAIDARAGRRAQRLAHPPQLPLGRVVSLHQHLRRVDERGAIRAHFVILPLRELRGGKAVAPAQPVPVVDVVRQRERGGLRVAGRKMRRKSGRQPAIGRRTAVAAFGRKQFDQRHSLRSAGGVACRRSGARRYREKRQPGRKNGGSHDCGAPEVEVWGHGDESPSCRRHLQFGRASIIRIAAFAALIFRTVAANTTGGRLQWESWASYG